MRRVTPTLVSAIDRAVGLCSDTLDYVRLEQAGQKHERFPLALLIADIAAGLDAAGETLAIENEIGNGLELDADREQMFRVLNNLTRNAAEAGARHVAISARETDRIIEIRIRDDGPGIAARAREKLFRPFEGSVRAGGTGLGLAIARELAQENGGDLSLVETGEDGTEFRLTLPAV